MELASHNPWFDDKSEEAPALGSCPICDGKLELVYSRHNQQVLVCRDCHSGVTIPSTARDIVRVKREAKWMPKPAG
jgi:ssDNA-binding Zn-finger/Zn-ribbon topoisomerase 1